MKHSVKLLVAGIIFGVFCTSCAVYPYGYYGEYDPHYYESEGYNCRSVCVQYSTHKYCPWRCERYRNGRCVVNKVKCQYRRHCVRHRTECFPRY